MFFFSQDDNFINAECEKCGRVLKVSKEMTIKNPNNYSMTKPIACPCGNIFNEISNEKPSNIKIPNSQSSNNQIKCPKCHSTQLTANKKGFGLGKAAVGGILTGGVGLLAGFIGSGKVQITCLNCGHHWTVGKK